MYKGQWKTEPQKLVTIQEGMERYRLSRTTLMKLAEKENAIRRFTDRCVRIDCQKMDKALELY